MATVTKTIKKTSGDYSTIASWEAATNLNSNADIWKGVISDNEDYDENIVMNVNGVGVTSYVWLTVASANRHAGIAGTGHARMYNTTSEHVFTMEADFARVSWLDIKQAQTGGSDEGFRVIDDTYDVLIQYCIIHGDGVSSNQDGIYVAVFSGTTILRTRIDNCIIYGWQRYTVHYQQGTSTAATSTTNIDHCSLMGASGGDGGMYYEQDADASDAVYTCYNTWVTGNGTISPIADGSTSTPSSTPDGSMVWAGANNAVAVPADLNELDGTVNFTTTRLATSGLAAVSKTTGSWIVVTNLTGGSEDLTLLDDKAGNMMAGGGVDRQGSEPDSRQDFSTAIDGDRPTTSVDIGASQISTAGGSIFNDFVSALADATAVITDVMVQAETSLAASGDALGVVTDTMVQGETLAAEASATAVITNLMVQDESLAAEAAATAVITNLMVQEETLVVSGDALVTITDAQVLVLEALVALASATALVTDTHTLSEVLAAEAAATATITNLMVQDEVLVAEAAATAVITNVMTMIDALVAQADATIVLTDSQVLVLEALSASADATAVITNLMVQDESLAAEAAATAVITNLMVMEEDVSVLADALATIVDSLVVSGVTPLGRFLRTHRRDPRGGRQAEGRQLSN